MSCLFSREPNTFNGISFKTLERRMRREVANSNERRRMQNINNGFDDLKSIVCSDDDGKISKVGVDQLDLNFHAVLRNCRCKCAKISDFVIEKLCSK